GTFVGYFLSNESSAPGEVSAQAICVQGTAGFAGVSSEPNDDDGPSSPAIEWAQRLEQLEIAATAAGLTPR
ncbi:MAG TPA: hypothetical protein VIT64_06195, partial [Ilumatobacteraceae bacterium]